MNPTVNTYGNLQLAPFELEYLQELTISKKINEHTRMQFTGIISPEKRDTYLHMAQSPVEIAQITDEGKTTLFKGIVTNIKIQAVGDTHHIEAEALSASYLLDIKRNSRSFQDQTMTYLAMIKEVLAGYQDADVIDTAKA